MPDAKDGRVIYRKQKCWIMRFEHETHAKLNIQKSSTCLFSFQSYSTGRFFVVARWGHPSRPGAHRSAFTSSAAGQGWRARPLGILPRHQKACKDFWLSLGSSGGKRNWNWQDGQVSLWSYGGSRDKKEEDSKIRLVLINRRFYTCGGVYTPANPPPPQFSEFSDFFFFFFAVRMAAFFLLFVSFLPFLVLIRKGLIKKGWWVGLISKQTNKQANR